MTIQHAIIITGKTRLAQLIERFNTRPQAKFYIEHSGGDFGLYEEEHEVFHKSLARVQRALSSVLKTTTIERGFLPSYLFTPRDAAIVVGQDGLVANAAKYVGAIPIIAVNPDPARYDGVLLPFTSEDFIGAVEAVKSGRYAVQEATMACAWLGDGQRLPAFNDLFIGHSSHVSARYRITFKERTEQHSSSGIIVSTPAGATGWLSSLFNMADGLCAAFGRPASIDRPTLSRQAETLVFAVREPFISRTSQAELCAGVIEGKGELVVESLMPAGGVIFSDGVEADYLKFNSGAVARIGMSEERARLVIKGNL
jgi:NAD kinase